LRALARDEWGGMGSMGELLAAFVMPNDPAVAKLLKAAGESLSRHGHSPSLEGYQSGDPRRVYMLVAALWSAVSAEGLTYANPPRSFEQVGQKTRRPSSVLSEGLATCLDSTLLFAAAIEAVGLNPVIILQEGHCFVGAWLVVSTFRHILETDCSEVRKALAARELVTFETTLITQRPPAPFESAIKVAVEATSEAAEDQFAAVLDVTRARMAQILPLASHEHPAQLAKQAEPPSGPLPLPAAPDFSRVAVAESDERPTTPSGRVERWQRKLLDLSLRNRLLNFKDSKQSVPFVCPDVPLVEDELAAGKNLRIISLIDEVSVGDRDAEIHRARTNKDIADEFARAALARGEVVSPLTKQELTGRLVDIHRRVKNDMAEGGTNTLFLAAGFLRWKQRPDDSRALRAPLLLIPVKLVRSSAISPFRLVHHEDEVRFNATLIQLLKKDFDRDLTEFETDLPRDGSGIDIPLILERVRRRVRDIPGFEVVEDTALSTFSFAKYLMWKDLVDRVDQLESNRVVRHLIRDPDKSFESAVSAPIPRPDQVDARYEPKDIVHPLPADSSQLAAVMAAAEGQDFVLIGPPGTGKSQTIANMIAQCLANRKTVLFVAEKTAALDVVYRRLREYGLGDCCLELHSNKAERRKFLDQLQAAWENGKRDSASEWLTVSERLKIRRDALNRYVSALHAEDPSGWTVFKAMGVSVWAKDKVCPALDWPASVSLDANAYQILLLLVDELASTFRVLDPAAKFPSIKATEWSTSWETQFLQAAERVEVVAQSIQVSFAEFAASLGLSKPDASPPELKQFRELARVLLETATDDYRVVFHKEIAKLPAAVDQLETAISALKKANASTKGQFDLAQVHEIPVADLQQKWREANAQIWPLAFFAKRAAKRLLQSHAALGVVDPQNDLPHLRTIQEQLVAIDASPLAGTPRHWRRHETDAAALREHLETAQRTRRAVIAVGRVAGDISGFSKKVAPLLTRSVAEHECLKQARKLLEATQEFFSAANAYQALAGSAPFDNESQQVFTDAIATVRRIKAKRGELQRWTAWRGVKKRALAHGLRPLIDDLEAGKIEHENLRSTFEVAYVRWWLPKAIDRDDALRTFQKFRHEDAIQDFRQLDEEARKLASSHILRRLRHGLPAPETVPRKSELGLLRHQMQLKRPSKSIREVITGMPESFGKLAPCVLMSPLSIAHYLPADQALFDVVLFDEASQITTWDAIGAIARGRQTIIVGDPKQLPPTNFFGRADDDETNDELEDHERDLESILDEAKASGLPTLQLNWHYRSRHESLIAFSNRHYYGNQLITFPSAVTADTAVSLCHLPDAFYDRGKSRANRREAERIVADAVARMKEWLDLPEAERPTLGVITFNSQQQSLIQDLFDQALVENQDLEWFFSDARIEPTVVKNLENVQGDERDIMFFSITYGRDKPLASIPRNFGALNRDGGERRLNVAVTRARQQLVVYSSFKAEELDVTGIKALGVWHLKNFLDYAQRGSVALAEESRGSVGGFDSPFEEAVAEALTSRGWRVVPQVGVSGFRVDLGVVHPDFPGRFLAGVECDGATYHRSATARDRDKTREQVLSNLGWNILRVWSPDWWYDGEGAAERIDRELRDLLDESRGQCDEELESSQASPTVEDGASPATDRPLFRRANLDEFPTEPATFFEESASEVLGQMIKATLETEAPIRDDILHQRIARAYGWQRTGTRIRQRIDLLLSDYATTEESSGRFIWATAETTDTVAFRYPATDNDRRGVDEISIAELRGLISAQPDLLREDDPVDAFARHVGVGRLTKATRARLQEALSDRLPGSENDKAMPETSLSATEDAS
jgi:very-short-patch-repair endonuclease